MISNFLTYFCFRHLVIFVFLVNGFFCIAQTPFNKDNIDPTILNNFIQKELNSFRKRAKVDPVKTEFALSFAADDHSAYMLKKKKLTHNQRLKVKKTPKNRVDFYGAQFNSVGENVQVNNLNLHSSVDDKNSPLINTYEKLAEKLVQAWKNSPPHYANMINPNFKTSFTSVAIGGKGDIYACQLFGGSKYKDKYAKERDTIEFKPDRSWRCWRCKVRAPQGQIIILEDSTIIYKFISPRMLWGLLPRPSINRTRMRFFNPWRDGLAADIIVKSQYKCDSNSYHNGLSNVRGLLLEPVYKKDYMGIPFSHTKIVLGKVPSFINEDFEVNLVVIQNKRPCSNTMYNVMPSDFEVKIPINFAFQPSDAIMKEYQIDTLSKRLYFDKSDVTPNDSILPEIIGLVNKNKEILTKVKIIGLASIEGTAENNASLYEKRAEYLLKAIMNIGIDSSLVDVIATENFKDFRKDIIGTDYENLGEFNDSLLKEKLAKKELSNELEFILKNHRYVNIQLITRREYDLKYTAENVNEKLKRSIARKNINESIKLQRIQYGLALADKMSYEEIESVEIVYDKKNYKLLHNRALMKYLTDTITIESLKEFRTHLSALDTLKEKDRVINTSLAIIDYYLYTLGEYKNKKVAFYDKIRKWKYIDRVQQARILLNTATKSDWGHWLATGSRSESSYYFNKVKRYIRPARLDVDKTFEIASYYTFFWQYKYALNLTKGKINQTTNPEDLINFLKLIHLTDLKLPRNQYLNYFEKIRRYSGNEFCNYFNNPALNFQILDDEEIKKIYCKECGDN